MVHLLPLPSGMLQRGDQKMKKRKKELLNQMKEIKKVLDKGVRDTKDSIAFERGIQTEDITELQKELDYAKEVSDGSQDV